MVSEAFTFILTVEPSETLLPLAGLVMEIVGAEGVATGGGVTDAPLTVIVIGLEFVDTPLVSVALAVIVKVPVFELVHVALYG